MVSFDKNKLNRILDDADRMAPDFARKIQPLFEKNGWEYDNGIPSVFVIQNNIHWLIDWIRQDKSTIHPNGFGCVSSGRIQVRVSNYSELMVNVELVAEGYRV